MLHRSLTCFATAAAALLAVAGGREGGVGGTQPSSPARPVRREGWIVPAEGEAAMPVWGIDGGIAVGLWPMPGPRGLVRIYTPYLGHPPGRMINYVAVEPVVGGRRGFSELERSGLDAAAGKRMWTTEALQRDPRPGLPTQPARAEFLRIDGAEAMRLFICVEPFDNGARAIVRVTLRKDRPYEVAFAAFSAAGGAKMDACCLTVTMGNYARLRKLWLKDEAIDAGGLWPGFQPRGPRTLGFAPRRQWRVERMAVLDGNAVVAATSDEADPAAAAYDASVPRAWRYQGRPAVQYWIAPRTDGLVVRVNGRSTYWNSRAPIPGGVSFENFELDAPFRPGQEFRFGVAPLSGPFGGITRAWLESTRRGVLPRPSTTAPGEPVQRTQMGIIPIM